MKLSRVTLVLVGMAVFFLIDGPVNKISAQTPLPKCKAAVDQIYFVDSGQQVTDVHPGGNGYQLNILGTGADKFSVVKEPYMTSVSLVSNYTNSSQAKWQIYFNPRMGRDLTKIKLLSACTGRVVHEFDLTVQVVLRDQ